MDRQDAVAPAWHEQPDQCVRPGPQDRVRATPAATPDVRPDDVEITGGKAQILTVALVLAGGQVAVLLTAGHDDADAAVTGPVSTS